MFIQRGLATTNGQRPDYPPSDEFVMPWWHDKEYGEARSCEWMSAVTGAVEVARFMLEPRQIISPRFGLGTPPPLGFLEVVFLEVAASSRRAKIGTRIVAEIERSHKGRQLMAVSQDSESDRFWATLGWQRHEHSVLAGTRALYVAQINDAS